MCIVLLTTSHPDYALILLSNRDEFLHRKTARAAFWDPPHTDILSGRDLARPEKGTWLGITRRGRICVLTNYHEASSSAAISQKSRGAITTSFLTSGLPPRRWLHSAVQSGEALDVGGFSLCFGVLRASRPPLAVISNRTPARDAAVETSAHLITPADGARGLSNSLFSEPWAKVEVGSRLLEEATAGETAGVEEMVERCFRVLSHDTLPKIHDGPGGDSYQTEIDALPESVFIPAFSAAVERRRVEGLEAEMRDVPHDEVWRKSPRVYGTQTQTVVLVRKDGWVRYTERRLYDDDCVPIPEGERDVVVEFQIEGWEDEVDDL